MANMSIQDYIDRASKKMAMSLTNILYKYDSPEKAKFELVQEIKRLSGCGTKEALQLANTAIVVNSILK